MKSMELVTRDDLDNTPGARTVEFVIDGEHFEIDLSEDNLGRLKSCVAEFTQVARRKSAPLDASGVVNREPLTSAARARLARRLVSDVAPPRVAALDARAVREWAAQNGIALAPRGPISSAIIDQFKAAHAESVRSTKRAKRIDYRPIRKWAAQNDIWVPARGPIDEAIVRRYQHQKGAQGRPAKTGAVDARAVREWAAQNGIALAPRGPISSTIIDQFKAAR